MSSPKALPVYARFEVALVCPDCDDHHRIMAWTANGKFPDQIAVATGAAGGWFYTLTGEDLGTDGGVSVPVYRATSRFKAPELEALPFGKFVVPRG